VHPHARAFALAVTVHLAGDLDVAAGCVAMT
jgi:hypothetical protein